MALSPQAKLMSGATLLAAPTILYGGVTLLGVLTEGTAGLARAGVSLDERQWALWRAGHAHAGVWVILSLVVQVLLDDAKLSSATAWLARIAAPFGAIAVSGGFFGLAYAAEFRWLLYLGALAMLVSLLLTGIGLLRGWRARP